MRRTFVMLAGVIAAASWTACVGDDPVTGGSNGPATGDRLGPCFDDGKCKEGLECRLPERICLTPGEPVPPDAGIDAGAAEDGGTDAGDSRPDAAVEGGAACVPRSEPSPGVRCGGTKCSSTEGCCVRAGVTACNTESPCTSQGGSFFTCDGPMACPAPTFRCCLVEAPVVSGATTMCTARLRGGSTTCMQSTCGSGQKMVCRLNSDCPSGNCVPTEIALDDTGLATTVWGICQ
jgi:hypothetical protein